MSAFPLFCLCASCKYLPAVLPFRVRKFCVCFLRTLIDAGCHCELSEVETPETLTLKLGQPASRGKYGVPLWMEAPLLHPVSWRLQTVNDPRSDRFRFDCWLHGGVNRAIGCSAGLHGSRLVTKMMCSNLLFSRPRGADRKARDRRRLLISETQAGPTTGLGPATRNLLPLAWSDSHLIPCISFPGLETRDRCNSNARNYASHKRVCMHYW